MKVEKAIKYFFIGTGVVALGYVLTLWANTRGSANLPDDFAAISNENTQGKILGEEETVTKMYSSQNFRSPQITFGGDAITIPSGEQSLAPEIQDLRSELLTEKGGAQVKFLLTWKTSKPCRSSVEYMRDGQEVGKTVADDSFGYVHSAMISQLNYSTSYRYIITAGDRWGNKTQSDKLAFYSGAPKVSIIDLLGKAFKDIFGWTNKM